jgi:hypothetical protein
MRCPVLARTQAAFDAVRRGHTRQVKVELWTPNGYVADVPISDGDVSWSLSTRDGLRQGNLRVPGYEWFALLDPGTSCWVEITVGIEGEVWHLGQFPVLRDVITRPGGTVNVQLGDFAYRRAVPQAEAAVTIGATTQTVAAVVKQYMDGVLPPVTITRDDSGGALVLTPVQLSLGDNVWGALVDVCNQVGCVPVITSRTTAEIRNFDAGTAVDDLTGTVERESIGVLADEAVNKVIAVVESSDYGVDNKRAEKTLTTGPYRYDPQGFGAVAIIVNERTPVATQAQANALMNRTYERRVGIVRTQAVEVVPQPWLEVGDSVTWQPSFMSEPVTGRIETIRFPLTADGSQDITLRDAVIR